MKTIAILLALALPSVAFAKTASIVGVVQDQSGGTSAPKVQALSFPAGETSTINGSLTHPDGTAYNLTGGQVLLTVGGAVISRQATIDNAAGGTFHFPIVIADTVSMLGTYSYDIWVTDSSGNRYQAVPTGSFVVTAAKGQPAQPVTVPATQVPLAQGPQGPAGSAGLPHTVAVAGVAQTTEPTLNFSSGVSCSDNPGNSSLDCSVAAGGTVTSVACGTGMSCSPSPITTTGTISLANTAVTAGAYGDASHSLSATVDAQGRLTALAANAIAIAESAVTGLVSDLAGKAPTTRLINAGTGLSGGGDLSADRTLSLANQIVAGSCTNCNLTYNAQGQITVAANGSGGGITGTLTSTHVPVASGTSSLTDGEEVFTSATHTYSAGASTVFDYSGSSGQLKTPTGTTVIGGSCTLPPAASISSASQGATNTTGITIAPNIADGATSIGLVVNPTTTLASGMIMRLENAGSGVLDFLPTGAIRGTGTTTSIQISNNILISSGGGVFEASSDDAVTSGFFTNRWSGVYSWWYDTKKGAQLTAAATITPTCAFHHVTGATTITTIATTNLPGSANVVIELVADGGTITYSTGGNIAVAGTITQNKYQDFKFDSGTSTWYPHN